MYEELVKALHEGAELLECSTPGIKNSFAKMCHNAADAIEELTKDLERSKNYEAFWNEEAEEALRRFQVAVANKSRWIPVTELCPEKSGDYLVYDDCGNLYVNEWHFLLKKWQYDDSRITHWMPLPCPPEEDKP